MHCRKADAATEKSFAFGALTAQGSSIFSRVAHEDAITTQKKTLPEDFWKFTINPTLRHRNYR